MYPSAKHLIIVLLCCQWLCSELIAQTNTTIDLSRANADFELEEKLADWFPDHSPRILRLYTDQMLGAQQRKALGEQGIELLAHRPDGSYLAWMSPTVPTTILSRLGFDKVAKGEFGGNIPSIQQSVGRYQESDKRTSLHLAIKFVPSATKAQRQALIKQSKLTVEYEFSAGRIITARLEPQGLDQLKNHPLILSIDQLPESLETFTDDGQILHQINILHGDGDGPGLQGDGVVIGVGEIGNVSDHIDLEGKIIRFGNGSVSYNEHTDHVVGILAGQATLDDNNGGVAPEGQIILAQNFDIIANAGLLQSQYGMVVTNNSYGPFLKCEREDNVNVFTEIIDKSLRELPEMLHVFAAGNFGNLSCEGRTEGFFNLSPSYAVAKNILTVGSVDINGEIAFNSSRGPTLDGRLKPEICAKGVQTISLSSGGGYTTKSGTSIAAPLVTGTSALLTEAYRLQHQGANPDGGLIKAILCNTANDLGLPGPDFTHGFGLMNARRALLSLKQNHFEKGTLSHAQEFEMPLQVEANANQLKVLLYWPDWENVENVIYDPALINDLDLEVIAPDGSLVLPTVADASRADQAAKRQVDRLNNIEQVIIDRPQAGTYTLRIKGHHIPFGPQPFYVSYEAIQPEVVLTYPNGGEQFAPEDEVLIVWDADALNDKSFRLEYSLNGGASWNSIASQIPAQERTYKWTLPAQYSETAMVRIRKNGTSLEDANELPFYILDQLERPELAYDCDGVLQLAWTASQTASRYEVLLYKDGALDVLATVDQPKASIPNLDYDQIQWVSVRGLTSSGLQTARTATIRVPAGLPDGPAFELELGVGVSCAGEMDGEATVLPLASSDNYTYQWDNGENGPTAFSLSAGVHRVTVTDALGCQQSASIEVPSPAPLSVTIRTQPAHAGKTDGEATAEVQGGTAPYTYRWSMAVSHTSSQVEQLAAGTYQLTITDDNACETVQDFTIDLSTSTQDLVDKGSFRLFPNPSPGPVQLDWAGLEQPQSLLQLFDLSGKLILEERLQHADRLQINRDWSDLPEGQYLLRLQNGTKQISRPWIKIKG